MHTRLCLFVTLFQALLAAAVAAFFTAGTLAWATGRRLILLRRRLWTLCLQDMITPAISVAGAVTQGSHVEGIRDVQPCAASQVRWSNQAPCSIALGSMVWTATCC